MKFLLEMGGARNEGVGGGGGDWLVGFIMGGCEILKVSLHSW